jgi:hypothetical protein
MTIGGVQAVKQKKVEFLQVRMDSILKKAIRKYCELNFIDQSSAVRIAIAQFPPIREIIEELQTK